MHLMLSSTLAPTISQPTWQVFRMQLRNRTHTNCTGLKGQNIVVQKPKKQKRLTKKMGKWNEYKSKSRLGAKDWENMSELQLHKND